MNLAITITILLLIPLALRYPFFGLLIYCWLDVVAPESFFAGTYDQYFRFSYSIAIASFIGYLLFEKANDKLSPKKDLAIWFFVGFFVWTTVTSAFAVFPETAWDKWTRLAKNVLIIIMLVRMIDTKERAFLFIGTLFTAITFHAIRGTAVTLLTGGGGQAVRGSPGTYLEERNYIAIAFIVAIPLGWFLWKYCKDFKIGKQMSMPIKVMTLMNLVSLVGTHSRGALLGILAASLIFLIASNTKIRGLIVIFTIGIIVLFLAPEEWTERMATTKEYQEDYSSMTRILAWKFAWQYALSNPILGGGFGAFRMNTEEVEGGGHREAHSVYFEVLGEHGFVGIALFLAMILSVLYYSYGAYRRIESVKKGSVLGRLALSNMMLTVGMFTAGAFGILSPFLITYSPIVILAALLKLEAIDSKQSGERTPGKSIRQTSLLNLSTKKTFSNNC